QEGAPGVGTGEAGLPEVLAGLDFKAIGDAVLAHEVAVTADEDGGADALGGALVLVMPKATGLGDVAAAAGRAGEGGGAVPGEGDDDAVGRDDGGGVDLVAEPVAGPELLTRPGVEGLQSFGGGQDELVVVSDPGDEGRGPGRDPIVGANAGLPAGL